MANQDKLSGSQFNPQLVPFAVDALKEIEIDNNISQLPISLMDQARLSYFFKDQLTNKHNKEYLNFCINHNLLVDYHHFLIVEFNDFSQYNHKYGWEKGDILLKGFAMILESFFPKALIYRVHGDVFITISKPTIDTKKLAMKTSDIFINTGIKMKLTTSSLKNILNDINT